MVEPSEYDIELDRLKMQPMHPTPDCEGYVRVGLTYRQWLFGQILPVMISRHARLGDAIIAADTAVNEVLMMEAEAGCGTESSRRDQA